MKAHVTMVLLALIRPARHALPVLMLLAVISRPVNAGGAFLYEYGTQDVGRAVAGVAAIADTATTAFANPAGMARLSGSQLVTAAQAIAYRAEFESDAGTTFSGGNGGNAGNILPAVSAFYVHDVSPDFKLGFSLASFFGAGVDYGENWSGRYYVRHVDLLTAAAEPTFAARVNEWLSIGGGVGVVLGRWDQDAAINNPGRGVADGTLVIDGTAAGVFGSAGVLIELSPRSRIGLAYVSPADLDFDDVVELRGLGRALTAAFSATGLLGSEIDIELTVPQQLMLSGYHQLNDRLELMANLGWQDWSEFGLPTISVQSTSSRTVVADRSYEDTFHAALGGRYTLENGWRLSAGIAVDTSAVKDADRTPDFAVDRQWRFSFGAERQWGDDKTLGIAYTFMDGGDAAIRQTGGPLRGALSGKYDENHIHFLAANLSWRF